MKTMYPKVDLNKRQCGVTKGVECLRKADDWRMGKSFRPREKNQGYYMILYDFIWFDVVLIIVIVIIIIITIIVIIIITIIMIIVIIIILEVGRIAQISRFFEYYRSSDFRPSRFFQMSCLFEYSNFSGLSTFGRILNVFLDN